MYDVSSRESFNNLANWLTDARTLASPAIVIVLVGNKKDLEEEREVTFLEASRYGSLYTLVNTYVNFNIGLGTTVIGR